MRRAVLLPLLASFAVSYPLSSIAPVSAAGTCSPPSGSQFRVSAEQLASPTPLLICQARLALQGHATVTATGTAGGVTQLSAVLGVSLPQASATQPSQHAYLGARLDARGVLQTYEGFAAPGQELQAAAQLTKWASTQTAPPATRLMAWASAQTAQATASTALASQPPTQAWTALSTAMTSYRDSNGSTVNLSMSDYRLNDINSGGDWYLFVTQLQTTPGYAGCDSNTCGWYIIQRYVNVPFASPLSLFDWGPSTTITGTGVSWTVGTSLSAGYSDVAAGVNTSYTQTWDQPSVVTTDQSSRTGGKAGWIENFSGPSYNAYPSVVAPPATATATFGSEQAAIFQVPEGTASFTLTGGGGFTSERDTWTAYSCYIFFTCYSESSSFAGSSVSLRMTPQPPVLSASPTSLQVPRGSSATLNIQALVPGSTQGLTWDITNIPSWLAVSNLSGSTSAPVTLTVGRHTPVGSVAYLNINTSPGYAAPSVEHGPIVVTVVVTR
jgi:hypothetical protein